MKKIIIVVAHPDDAELGMGMKIKSYSQAGDVVKIIVATNGEYKDSQEGRLVEAKRAAKVLDVKELFMLGFPCANLVTKSDQLRTEIEKIIKNETPDVVYTIFPNDLHNDHQVVSNQTIIAARSVPDLIFFRVAYSNNFNPNLFFCADIKLFKFKIKALLCYKDEVKKKGTINLDSIMSLSEYEINRYMHHSLVSKIRIIKKLSKSEHLYFEYFVVDRLISI